MGRKCYRNLDQIFSQRHVGPHRIRSRIFTSISKFCHIFFIYRYFLPEMKVKMCKIYTAFPIFLANVNRYIAQFIWFENLNVKI